MNDLVGLTEWAWLLGLIGLAFAAGIYGYVKRQPPGTEVMVDLGEQIHDGAMAFLRREYTVLAVFVVIVAVLLGLAIGTMTAVAYIFGAASSVGAGFFGMKAATRANTRTAAAAKDEGQGKALRVAFFGGAVMGLAVAALGMIGLGVLYFIFAGDAVPGTGEFPLFAEIVSGFAMGASSIALFARVGGGIYTKAADVGADLVGKVEAGIPEDDPRNPATIADNVGDNVGDVAGMGADIFESYVGSMVATIAIGATAPALVASRAAAVSLPILTVMVGLVASLVGIGMMKVLERTNPAAALRNVTFIAAALFLAGVHMETEHRFILETPKEISSKRGTMRATIVRGSVCLGHRQPKLVSYNCTDCIRQTKTVRPSQHASPDMNPILKNTGNSTLMRLAGPSGLLVLPGIIPVFFILLLLRQESTATPGG